MRKSQMKLAIVFRRGPADGTPQYGKWFHSVENYLKWHGSDFEDDIDKVIWIGVDMDGHAGTRYKARAEYMKK